MRYYTYCQPANEQGDPEYITMSENEIRKEYWPHWYQKMCDKYERSYVDENYSFEDCLDDWKIIHWAWISD